ncbi:hypothetical protein SAMN04489810_0021 [Microbacterium pygmaeum]|uniref:Uncharacterized protein n=1 Tax=Microbacterium pygmaeum TaxID=370764 RepID=A0A1G7TEA7_9MICO|nr:hypothetical protein SAMN04489810_0021 [Microbacterium pygmaeum]
MDDAGAPLRILAEAGFHFVSRHIRRRDVRAAWRAGRKRGWYGSEPSRWVG